jgi:Mg/Co/Ni transporter MgtE
MEMPTPASASAFKWSPSPCFRPHSKLNLLKAKLHEIHPVDLADILEELSRGERMALFRHLETEHASDTLEEIEPRVQRELIAALSKGRATELIEDMTPSSGRRRPDRPAHL